MDKFYGPLGMDGYVSKYVDKHGCTLEEACNELGLSIDEVFKK